jgi:hypothetical protein
MPPEIGLYVATTSSWAFWSRSVVTPVASLRAANGMPV